MSLRSSKKENTVTFSSRKCREAQHLTQIAEHGMLKCCRITEKNHWYYCSFVTIIQIFTIFASYIMIK